jgi:hypothetical protein
LFLWLGDSALDAPVVGWANFDGASEGPVDPVEAKPDPPYATGLDALRDGWRLIQVSPLIAPVPGEERTTSFLKHEFIFEKLVEAD